MNNGDITPETNNNCALNKTKEDYINATKYDGHMPSDRKYNAYNDHS